MSAALFAAQSASLPAQAQQLIDNSNLTVEITGLRNTQGQVCFSLFNGSVGFPNDPEAIVEKQCIAATDLVEPEASAEENKAIEATHTVTFEGLKAGTYAVSILHDENEDDEISTGAFGIPTEGFGFSQNPAIRMGAPKFSEAAVVVVGSETTAQIALIYF